MKSVYTAVTGGASALNQDVRDYVGGVKEVALHTEEKVVETVSVVIELNESLLKSKINLTKQEIKLV